MFLKIRGGISTLILIRRDGKGEGDWFIRNKGWGEMDGFALRERERDMVGRGK